MDDKAKDKGTAPQPMIVVARPDTGTKKDWVSFQLLTFKSISWSRHHLHNISLLPFSFNLGDGEVYSRLTIKSSIGFLTARGHRGNIDSSFQFQTKFLGRRVSIHCNYCWYCSRYHHHTHHCDQTLRCRRHRTPHY